MAKLKVKQIEDLGIVSVGATENAAAHTKILIGAEDIIPLTGVQQEAEGASGYISGLNVSGNELVISRADFPAVTVTAAQNLPEGAVPFVRDITANGHTITKTMGAIGNGLAIDTNGVLNLNLGVTPAAGETGQVISGLSYAYGVLAPTYSTVAAANVTIADAGGKFTAENVEGALAELAGSIAAIDPVVTTVVEGTGIKVTDTAAEGSNDHAYKVEANFTVDTIKYGSDAGNKAGKTYIRIMDGTTIISETDAAAFVQDGFLREVELIEASEGQENVLRFTWNSDAGAQVTDIKVSDLCDVYKAKADDWIKLNGFEFSHKTQGAFTQVEGQNAPKTTFGSGSATDSTITVKVPSFTVDAAGHVTTASETEVSLEIPASVASAVQTVNGDDYVTATKNGTTVTLATVTGNVADGEDKLATAHSVKTYVDGKIEALDAEVTSADGTNVQVKVTEVDGKITAVNVVTDNSINATDLANAINALDADKSGSNVSQDITVQVVETDGKITAVNVSDTLKSVAHTGAAADVSIADTENVINATTVEGALVEIAKEIDKMDLASTAIVSLVGGTALQASNIKEEDGKVTVETAAALVEFNQALSSTNKVATMADITDAAVSGQNAIDVTNKVVSLKIKEGDKVLDQTADGLFSTLSLTYDTTADAQGKKYIRLIGKENAEISKIDAAEFIKDGMLSAAELVTTAEQGVTDVDAPYIKLTFNTDAGSQVLRFSVKSLVDVYTSGDTNTLTVSGYTITPVTATVAANATGLAVAGDVHAKIAATKGQDIQTITGETAIENGSSFVSTAVTATKGQNDDNYTLSSTSTVTTQAVGTATADANGLATAYDVKTYVDGKVAGQSNETITLTQIVRGTANENFVELAVPDGYSIVAASTVGFLNGQLVPSVNVSGNTVTYLAYEDVAYTAGDRFDVVATVTKTITVVTYTAPQA